MFEKQSAVFVAIAASVIPTLGASVCWSASIYPFKSWSLQKEGKNPGRKWVRDAAGPIASLRHVLLATRCHYYWVAQFPASGGGPASATLTADVGCAPAGMVLNILSYNRFVQCSISDHSIAAHKISFISPDLPFIWGFLYLRFIPRAFRIRCLELCLCPIP